MRALVARWRRCSWTSKFESVVEMDAEEARASWPVVWTSPGWIGAGRLSDVGVAEFPDGPEAGACVGDQGATAPGGGGDHTDFQRGFIKASSPFDDLVSTGGGLQ